MSLSNYAKRIIHHAAPEEDETSMTMIHPEIYVKNRSLNLLVGKPGSSKTTSICQELIKISALNIPENHLIIWVNNTSSDKTVSNYKKFINMRASEPDAFVFTAAFVCREINTSAPKAFASRTLWERLVELLVPSKVSGVGRESLTSKLPFAISKSYKSIPIL